MRTLRRIFLCNFVASAIACALATAAAAEEALPEIVVSAKRASVRERSFATPKTVIDASVAGARSNRSIGEAVAGELGVTSSDFGAGVGRPIIRGLGGSRVQVLEGGMGSLDLSTISPDHAVSIEPIFADQIEILRGPATLLYSSGSSGGLINVVNHRIPASLPQHARGVAYSHFDSAATARMGAFKVEVPLAERLVVHLDALRRVTEDVEIPGFAETDPSADARSGILPNSDTRTDNYSAGGSLLGAGGVIGFNVSRLLNEYGVPGSHEEHEGHASAGASAPDSTSGSRVDLAQMRYDVAADFKFDAGVLETLNTRWAYNDYEHDEIEADGAVATHFENRAWEGRLEARLRWSANHEVALGGQFRGQELNASGEEAFIPPAQMDNIALFAFQQADLDAVHLDFGLRFEHQQAERTDNALRRRHDLINLSGSAHYNFAAQQEIGIALARAERAPTLEELFANGQHLATSTFEIGTADLTKEISTNIEGFWRKLAGRYQFDVTLFYNHIADFIFLAENDRNSDGLADRVAADFLASGIIDDAEDLVLVNQRQVDADFWGVEAEVVVNLFAANYGRLDSRLWTDYVRARLTRGGRVPRLPPLRFGIQFDYARAAAAVNFELTRVTSVSAGGALETTTAGYTDLSIHARYKLAASRLGELSVFLRATNLLNQERRRHTSFVKDIAPLAARSALLGVRFDF